MKRREFLGTAAATAILPALGASPALAQWQPRRPINIIVPYNTGGGTDTYARALATGLQDILGVPIVIANCPGSGGIVGATEAASARPDGTNFLVTTGGGFVMGWLFRDTPVNPFDDFQTVSQIGAIWASIAVPYDSPYQTAADLIADARANPGTLRWAHTGRGALLHVAGQSLLNANGIEAVDVPFRGGGAVRTAVIGGQVDFASIGVHQARGFENEMRVLGLIANQRDTLQPDIPTFGDLGFPYTNVYSPITMFAPNGVDDEILSTMDAAIQAVTSSTAFAETLEAMGNLPFYLDGAEALAELRAIEQSARPIIEAL
ncbi:Bug family tripartite tricarboxylate transporter substrate binding protein [Nioella sp.]|uniref:Bug family tripartite tricarboxylate transporter substrate binding protein n=1 Tax=Nioella sp. TaxID=1912091 RepID=UPI003A84728A